MAEDGSGQYLEVLSTAVDKQPDSNNEFKHIIARFDKWFDKRCSTLFTPIKDIRVDPETRSISFIMLPEAFRAWFYIGFWLFTLLAFSVTAGTAQPSLAYYQEHNIIRDTWGSNNICIYYDPAPFNYFSAWVWVPILSSMLFYLFLDNMRVYFSYAKDGTVSKKFYVIYTVFSCIHAFAFIWFEQIFAVTPDQSVYGHAIPFVFLQLVLWSIALTHYIYFVKIGTIRQDWISFGIVYLSIMFVVVIFKVIWDSHALLSRLTGKALWNVYNPTANTLVALNDGIFMFFVTVSPLFIYLYLATELTYCSVTLNFVNIHTQPQNKLIPN